MIFKVVNQINPIIAMKSFKKHNFNLCMEEHLRNLKKLSGKRVTLLKITFGDIWGLPAQKFFL